MRLIDADALKEYFESSIALCNEWIATAKDKETKIRASAVKTFIGEVLIAINNAPTVDTYTEDDVHCAIKEGHQVGYEMAKAKFERPQGEWLEVKEEVHYDYWTVCECSLCKHSWALGELSIEDIKDDYKFCPNCGADMRGGRE